MLFRTFLVAGCILANIQAEEGPNRRAFFAAPTFDQAPAREQILSERTEGGILTQEIYFSGGWLNGQEARIHGYYSRPVAPGTYPAVLDVHGAGLIQLNPDFSIQFAQHGFACLSIDWAGKSENRPEPRSDFNSPGVMARALPEGEQHLAPPNGWKLWDQDSDRIRAGVIAAKRAFMLLRSKKEVKKEQICLSGVSAGAHLSLLILGNEPGIRAATVKYGAGYIAELGMGGYFFPISLTSLEKQKSWLTYFDPKHGLPHVQASTMMFSGTDDFFFWMPAVLQTYRTLSGEKRLIMRANDDHGQVGNNELPASWFKTVLGQTSPWPTIQSIHTTPVNGQLELRVRANAVPEIGRVDFTITRQPIESFHWRSEQPESTKAWFSVTASKSKESWTATIPEPSNGEQVVIYATAYDHIGREVSSDTIEIPKLAKWRLE